MIFNVNPSGIEPWIIIVKTEIETIKYNGEKLRLFSENETTYDLEMIVL